MEKIAFVYQGQFIYWRTVFILLGSAGCLLLALAMRFWKKRSFLPVLITAPIAALLSVYAARLIHWYCRFESYNSLSAAMLTLSGGGYSLIGAFAGTLLACALARLLALSDDLPALVDDIAPGAALGIAVGRLGEFFSSANRGKLLITDEALKRLPFAAAVINPSSGAVEWRFATFCAQSLWSALLCLILLLRAAIPKRRIPARESWRSGNEFLLFLSLYCLGQILLDSTRYDALFLRSNGFVSLEQIVCCAAVMAVTALYSVRALLHRGFRWSMALCWLLSLGGMGLVGYMEYYVQRHGDAYLMAYSLMALGLLLFFIAQRILYRSTLVKAKTGE